MLQTQLQSGVPSRKLFGVHVANLVLSLVSLCHKSFAICWQTSGHASVNQVRWQHWQCLPLSMESSFAAVLLQACRVLSIARCSKKMSGCLIMGLHTLECLVFPSLQPLHSVLQTPFTGSARKSMTGAGRSSWNCPRC